MCMRLAHRTLWALIAGVILCIACELSFRAAAHAFGDCHPACITQYDSATGWTNRPESRGRHRNPALGFDVTYRIGQSGLRGRQASAKVPGVQRIVVLGDSNGFGWGVPDGREFPALLDRAFDGVDVLNLSVTGYGTDQEYLKLRNDGPALAPDVVILQVTPNDLADVQRLHIAGRPKPYFTLDDHALELHNVPVRMDTTVAADLPGSFLPLWIRTQLQRDSYAYAWLYERSGAANRTSRNELNQAQGFPLFKRLLQEIEGTARTLGATLLILHASADLDRAGPTAFPPDIAVLDLSPDFAAAGGTLYADEIHWNERGHRVAAEQLASWLESRLPERAR